MCQPPEVSLPSGGDAIEAANSADAWSSEGWSSPNQGAAAWDPTVQNVRDAGQSVNLLAAQEQALLFKYGQQQQQQRQRAAQLAAISSLAAAPAPQPATWNHQDLTAKLQRAAAAATGTPMVKPAGPGDWLARQHPGVPFVAQPAWPAPQPMPQVAPALVAQGIPLGMPHLGQMDPMGFMQEQHEDEDELDPKKFKRMMSNRASAKRSRQRRQERLDELEIVSAKLQVENATVQRRLNEANERIRKYQEENEALQEELKTLKEMVEAKGLGNTMLGYAAGTTTKQDSCGPNGSTSEHTTSDPSSPPSLSLSHKRRRDEAAESCYQDDQHAPGGKASLSPGSAVTSDSEKEAAKKVEAAPAAGDGVEIEVMDDDLFSSFMEECFEGKPLETKS